MTSLDFSLTERLETLPYFRTLNSVQLDSLAQQAQSHTYDPGEMLLMQDSPSAGLWIVEQGRVKIFRLNPDGREHILLIMGPGDSFNEIPALDGGPNPANVVALTGVIAWIIPTDALRTAIESDHQLALTVIGVLADRTRQLVQKIENLALCSVTTRLARFILEQENNAALSGPGITRTTIAAHLATTPESISRSLRTLEEIGAIRFDREQITVIRQDLLESVASC